MAKTKTEMAAEIVAAQAGHAVMSAEEMETALKRLFEALRSIHSIEEGTEPEPAPMDPKKSIQRSYIINLEDGKKYKVLTSRTLAKFGLTTAEYRKKYGFPAGQPLAAKALSAKRRKTAKTLKLGEKLQAARKISLQQRRKKKRKKEIPPKKKKA